MSASFFNAMGKAANALGLDYSHVAYDLARAVHPDDMDAVLYALVGPQPAITVPQEAPAEPLPVTMPGEPAPAIFTGEHQPTALPPAPLASESVPPENAVA